MPALSDHKLEAFAQALLRNVVAGMSRSKAADEAAKEAKYGGSSRAANARKRANRKDVKARMVELAAPKQDQIETDLALDVQGAKSKLAEIIRADEGVSKVKPPDVIAAIKQLSTMEGWDAPKRSELTGKGGAPLFVDPSKLTDEQLAQLEGILAAAGSVPLN